MNANDPAVETGPSGLGSQDQDTPTSAMDERPEIPTEIDDELTDDMGAMRSTLVAASTESGLSMKALTVLSPQIDPFRQDTPANHRDAQWLADATQGLYGTIHLRGLHYRLVSADPPLVKPDGTRYVNDDANWLWLGGAAKAARWLGYIGFERIVDHRNGPPLVQLAPEELTPRSYLNVDIDLRVPALGDLEPFVMLDDFEGVQPYRLVLAGEKSSLHDVLGPLANRYGADLYLPTGEMSDTMVHTIAKSGDEDGRPVIVLYFADCDPAGWQMPISVGWKLIAMRTNLYPDLTFQVHRVGLTPDQVRAHNLPMSPLKASELRGDRWREAMGVAQTEIDALAALQPGLLRQIAEDAIAPFYDHSLDRRVFDAQSQWLNEAEAALDVALDHDQLEAIRAQAEAKLDEVRAEIDSLNDGLRLDASDVDLPEVPPIPGATIDHTVQPLPLVDSEWSFIEQSRALKSSKEYSS